MSILTLIIPFKYQFQVVSVLPKELYHFIETISPNIFGIFGIMKLIMKIFFK